MRIYEVPTSLLFSMLLDGLLRAVYPSSFQRADLSLALLWFCERAVVRLWWSWRLVCVVTVEVLDF